MQAAFASPEAQAVSANVVNFLDLSRFQTLMVHLPVSTRLRFEAHLAQCSGCRTYLEQMRQTIGAMGRLSTESIEPQARDRLLEVFRDWKRRPA